MKKWITSAIAAALLLALAACQSGAVQPTVPSDGGAPIDSQEYPAPEDTLPSEQPIISPYPSPS